MWIKSSNAFFSLFFVGVLLLGCSADTKNTKSTAGVCETGEGSEDTYNIIGKWKKISSTSETPTTANERDFNYDLLVVEPGASICMGKIINKAMAGAVFKGVYNHDVQAQEINVSYTAHIDSSLENTDDDIRYSFSGSCGETKLSFQNLNDGTIEQYELFSTKVEQGDCN